MTFEDLTCDLPNGLHDAELLSVNHDLLNRTVILDMDVWIGTMADPPERRERYRRAGVNSKWCQLLVRWPSTREIEPARHRRIGYLELSKSKLRAEP